MIRINRAVYLVFLISKNPTMTMKYSKENENFSKVIRLSKLSQQRNLKQQISINIYFLYKPLNSRIKKLIMNPVKEYIKMKQKQVILLVDNRRDKEPVQKPKLVDFRNSAFKQTQIDPCQPRPDFSSLNQEDLIIFNLKRKVIELEKRVSKLQFQNSKGMNSPKNPESEGRKKRRTFSQLTRDFKCPHAQCEKIYGSDTSLKNHIKLKHGSQKPIY